MRPCSEASTSRCVVGGNTIDIRQLFGTSGETGGMLESSGDGADSACGWS